MALSDTKVRSAKSEDKAYKLAHFPKNDTAIIKFCPKISETKMKKVRFAKTQIVTILKLADSGMTVDDICYQNRISNGIY